MREPCIKCGQKGVFDVGIAGTRRIVKYCMDCIEKLRIEKNMKLDQF